VGGGGGGFGGAGGEGASGTPSRLCQRPNPAPCSPLLLPAATALRVRTATGGEAPPGSQGISPLSDRMSQAFSEFKGGSSGVPAAAGTFCCCSRVLIVLSTGWLHIHRTHPSADPNPAVPVLWPTRRATDAPAGTAPAPPLLTLPLPLPPFPTVLLCLCLTGEDEYHDAVEEFEANASGRYSIDSHVSSPRSGHSHDPDLAAQQQQQQEPPGLAARLTSWWEGLKAGPASSSGSLGGGGGGGFGGSGHLAGDDATPRAPGSPHPPVRTAGSMFVALGKRASTQPVIIQASCNSTKTNQITSTAASHTTRPRVTCTCTHPRHADTPPPAAGRAAGGNHETFPARGQERVHRAVHSHKRSGCP
jgi:hypothetical protein